MRKIYLGLLLTLGMLSEVSAQQDPHYTQYMYNMSVMNPAYAGSKDNLSLGLLHREQWIELEDAPVTSTFFGHSPVGKNVGLGLSVISDKLGPVQENNIYGDFSYTLKLGGEHKLALGLKAGLTLHNVDYLTKYGKGWVCEIENTIVGFSIVGLQQRNVWALFVHPEFEGKGIGKKLHDVMIDWYFKQTKENIWLGTEFNTRAEQFYRNAGWIEVGTNSDDDIKFEMTYNNWKTNQKAN